MKKRRKLSRTSEHRKMLLRMLATNLFKYEKIRTTYAKAKELEMYASRIIEIAKKDNLHNRRRIHAMINDDAVCNKIFTAIAPRYKDRVGGYISVLKLGRRPSDGALMGLVRLV